LAHSWVLIYQASVVPLETIFFEAKKLVIAPKTLKVKECFKANHTLPSWH
jgi:hypothetical protein